MKKKVKSCPVGLVCVKGKHLLILLIVVILVLFCYLIKSTNKKNNKISNFSSGVRNNKKSRARNSNNSINNNNRIQIERDSIKVPNSEDTNITINYQMPKQEESSYLINKDYERLVNPLEPPERRNFHLNSSGIERVAKIPGIPINVPTRGHSGGVVQVGVLHKDEVTDRTKQLGQNTEPVILPLFGCPTYNGSNKWSYYTSTDKHNQVKLPISNKNRVCNSEYGCDELYEGDTVSVPAYNGDFKVSVYEFDKPRYIPFV